MSWLIPEWLLALALTLFVVDLFTDEEGIVSWCGVAAIAGWATWRIGAPPMWSVLVFIGAFLVSGTVWYWLFRGFIGQPVRRLMQKDAPDETIDALKGAKGTLRVIEGRTMFRFPMYDTTERLTWRAGRLLKAPSGSLSWLFRCGILPPSPARRTEFCLSS